MTTTTATADRTILALDLGKYKSVACVYDPATAQARFDTLTTSREQLRKLFARVRPAAVVIEACLRAGWVHDLGHELGLPCHVANTAPMSEELVASARSCVDPSVTHRCHW